MAKKSTARGARLTAADQELLGRMLSKLTPKLEGWIKSTAATDPAKAAGLLLSALEFVQPRLQRSELTGADGEPVTINGTVSWLPPQDNAQSAS
jgi:hypothetical protein